MSSSSKNIIDTESNKKSQNDDDDDVKECPLNRGLKKKKKGKRKKSTSLRLKFSRKRNDASNPKDLVGLGMYVVKFDFINKNIHSYHKKRWLKIQHLKKFEHRQVHARYMEEGSARGVSIL